MVGYYSYLFTFPSRLAMVVEIVAICIVGSTGSFLVSSSMYWNLDGVLHGLIGLALPLLTSDLLVLPLFRGEVLLNPRRFTILTYASSIIYLLTMVPSTAIGEATGHPEFHFMGILFAAGVSALLRHMVIRVFSVASAWRNVLAAFLQPALIFFLTTYFFGVDSRSLMKGVTAFSILVASVELILWVMGRWEGGDHDVELIPLFRAFILAWAEDLNGPLEEQITRIGEERDLGVDSLVFQNEKGGCNAAFVVPYIHPGPFRNVGSSGLPVVIVDRVKEELGCEALVAHGISTHERDLTRSDDNDRVAEALAMDLLSPDSAASASPMVWAERAGARASCQLFGDAALVTLSLSPKSYDDLPNELREMIVGSAGEMGLDAVVVDSHNSIRLGGLEDYDPGDLHDAAIEAMRRAAGTPRQPFSVGAARVVPIEWGLDDGLGPCGIAALAVRLEGGQTSSYIVVDGNNMLSGLREKILGAVRALGVDEAEVMTSDIHLVNAVGKTTRGYHPIGERIDDGQFIGYVVEAVEKALSRLGRSGARHAHTVIPGLTVLGSGGLSTLSDVLESGFGLFKKTGLTVMPMAYLLSVAVLYFL
jgi:putative membrane protein